MSELPLSRIITLRLWEYKDVAERQFETKMNGKMGFIPEIEDWLHENDHEAAVIIFNHHVSVRFSTPDKAVLFKMFWT